MITKAIIPVAGWGTRRLPITKIIEKSMLPVGNRPLVDYSVQELVKAGVKDIYFVISNVEPCQVREFYKDNLALNQYLIDRGKKDKLEKAKTLPDDVRVHVPVAMVVEEYKIDEPVFVFFGDDFIWNPDGESAAESLLKAVKSPEESAILGVEVKKEEVVKYGMIDVKDGKLTKIVEKPKLEDVTSNLVHVSKYIMSPKLLQEMVEYVKSHDFGPLDQEYMATDPLATFVEKGGTVRVAPTTGEYLDGGSVEGWVHANDVVCGN